MEGFPALVLSWIVAERAGIALRHSDAVKVSPEGDRLITSGAHYLRMSKKDLVEAAVAFYLDARREDQKSTR